MQRMKQVNDELQKQTATLNEYIVNAKAASNEHLVAHSIEENLNLPNTEFRHVKSAEEMRYDSQQQHLENPK